MNTQTLNWNAVESLNDLNFGRAVVQAEEPVLVLFWAVGRPVRKSAESQAEEAAALHGETFSPYRVNLNENPFLADHFGLGEDPALILYHEGREVGRWQAARATETFPWREAARCR
jgi:thioredoxin-like negative regulator of GroEL